MKLNLPIAGCNGNRDQNIQATRLPSLAASRWVTEEEKYLKIETNRFPGNPEAIGYEVIKTSGVCSREMHFNHFLIGILSMLKIVISFVLSNVLIVMLMPIHVNALGITTQQNSGPSKNHNIRVSTVNHVSIDIFQQPNVAWQYILNSYTIGADFAENGYAVKPLNDELSAFLGGYNMTMSKDNKVINNRNIYIPISHGMNTHEEIAKIVQDLTKKEDDFMNNGLQRTKLRIEPLPR